MGNITLIADIAAVIERATAATGAVPASFELRPSALDDIEGLAALYFRSYEPGIACATEEEALADVEASFAGDYGAYLPEASPVAVCGSAIAAAVMTVERAPWDDTPTCPFVIELFTAPEHRRIGLASALLGAAAEAAGHRAASIALRVGAQNAGAIALYESLGFTRW